MEVVYGCVLDCFFEFFRLDVIFYFLFFESVLDKIIIENQVKLVGFVLVEDFVIGVEEEELIQVLGWGIDGSEYEI